MITPLLYHKERLSRIYMMTTEPDTRLAVAEAIRECQNIIDAQEQEDREHADEVRVLLFGRAV